MPISLNPASIRPVDGKDCVLSDHIGFGKPKVSDIDEVRDEIRRRPLTGEKIKTVELALTHFQEYFMSLEHAPRRTQKHIASPTSGSTCKRLNMFLRWMVRKDKQGVDFGLWKTISPSDLIMPIDVHVARVSRSLGILQRPQTDWLAALELTNFCRSLDPKDPVKYDFALFSLGVMEKYN